MRSSFFFACAALCASAAFSTSPSPALAQYSLTPPPLELYGELPAVERAVLSPSGRHTALLMTVQGQRGVIVLDSNGSTVKRLLVGDTKVRDILWAGDQGVLILRTELGKLPVQFLRNQADFVRGNVIPLDDSLPVVSIFAHQLSIANAIFGFYGIRNVKGRWVGYFGGFRKGSVSGDRSLLG